MEEQTVTFNDKEYIIDRLPDDIKELISVHQTWNTELTNQKREVFKLEGAMRSVLNELEVRFKVIDDAAAASKPSVAKEISIK